MRRWAALTLVLSGCSGASTRSPEPTVLPLPHAALAGQEAAVLPLARIVAPSGEGWDSLLSDRAAVRATADSLIARALLEGAPDVSWIFPPALRAMAARNPAVSPDPDRIPTAGLAASNVSDVPDPLRGQLRTLVALAGGRYVLIPASLVYTAAPAGGGRAEVTAVLVDVRTGRVAARSMATGDGADPWSALEGALRRLVGEAP